jgi:hypothetical protein
MPAWHNLMNCLFAALASMAADDLLCRVPTLQWSTDVCGVEPCAPSFADHSAEITFTICTDMRVHASTPSQAKACGAAGITDSIHTAETGSHVLRTCSNLAFSVLCSTSLSFSMDLLC